MSRTCTREVRSGNAGSAQRATLQYVSCMWSACWDQGSSTLMISYRLTISRTLDLIAPPHYITLITFGIERMVNLVRCLLRTARASSQEVCSRNDPNRVKSDEMNKVKLTTFGHHSFSSTPPAVTSLSLILP